MASTRPSSAAAASGMQQPKLVHEGLADLASLLELPDPDKASPTTVVSASAADATNATADSTFTQVQVAAPADSTADGPVPLTEMEQVLTELRGARDLSPRSKRLLAALAETAYAELNLSDEPTAAALRMRRVAFWRKLRVGILAETAYDDEVYAFPAATSGMQQPELVPEGLADLAPLLVLPDPDDASSTTVLFASAADATTAATYAKLSISDNPTAAALSIPRVAFWRKVRVGIFAETAYAVLSLRDNPTAAALRMRLATFWRKVRVGILAATVFAVLVIFFMESPDPDYYHGRRPT